MLPDRHWSILKLLQSAVRARADSFHIGRSNGYVTISHDGVPPEAHLISELFDTTSKETSTPADHALIVAAISLVQDGPVEIAYPTTTETVKLTLRRDGGEMKQSQAMEAQCHCRVRFARSARDFKKEIDLLCTTGRFAPLEIYCDDRRIERSGFGAPRNPQGPEYVTLGPTLSSRLEKLWSWLQFIVESVGDAQTADVFKPPAPLPDALPPTLWLNPEHHLLEIRFTDPQTHDMLWLPPPGASSGHEATWNDPHSCRFLEANRSRFRGVLAFKARINESSRIFIVRHGVIVDEIGVSALPPRLRHGLIGAIATSTCDTDLTGMRLLRDSMTTLTQEVIHNANLLTDMLRKRWSGATVQEQLISLLLDTRQELESQK